MVNISYFDPAGKCWPMPAGPAATAIVATLRRSLDQRLSAQQRMAGESTPARAIVS
ncbi:hypothetical protein [Mycobacterium paraseoulense]|uniref:hypothetical protein n=1 Tax=Mycobacterium paraseoulense TaxID=590652 RepID=UPI001301DF37|nr:hypothetical protein [Mycobacterium paraseoulense]MCV7396031.1 hypothetical protein [Mycobacterium paraseoulense]